MSQDSKHEQSPAPSLTGEVSNDYGPISAENPIPLSQSRPQLENVLVDSPGIINPSLGASNDNESPNIEPQGDRSSHRKSIVSSTGQGINVGIVQPEASPKIDPAGTNQEQPVQPPAAPAEADPDEGPFNPPNLPKINIDQVAPFWERYNKAADFEDREFVKAEGVNLDTLLIFAGLFSGVNTAFILESLKTIQPDPAEQANYLIRAVVHVLQNSTMSENLLNNQSFHPPPRAVRATIVFFASLSCSLTAAFGAVLGKQWLNHYEREGILKSPPARARERQKKYEARDRWRLEGVVETLPTVLQISLFLFFIGLVDYLQPINEVVSWAVLGFSLVPALFYVITIAIATAYPIAPFQTRLSIVLHDLLLRLYQSAPSLLAKVDTSLQSLRARLRAELWFNNVSRLRTAARRIWESTTHTRSWLSLQVSRLYKFGWQTWPFKSDGSHSQPPPSPPEPTVDLLDMRCMLFTCKRISTLQEISSILPALDSLVDSSRDLDRNHPMAMLLAHTVINSVIEPIVYSTRKQDNYQDVWQAAGLDLRYLVKPIHCIYVKWGHPSDFSDVFRLALERELWACFGREPLNIDLVGILNQLLPIIMTDDATLARDSVATLDLLIRCIQSNHTWWDPRLIIPHFSLLSRLPQHRLLNSESCGSTLTHNWESKYVKLVPALSWTMWHGREPDLDYWRGWMRIHILLTHGQDDLLEQRFSEYLLLWSRANANETWQGSPLSVQWPYLQALHKLLQLDTTSVAQAEQLEREGHISFLLQIARRELRPINTHDHSARSFNALFLLLKLWQKRQLQQSTVTTYDTPSIYLSSELVQVAVNYWTYDDICTSCVVYKTLGDLPSYMELSVSYFEEASRLGLITQDMETIVEKFKQVIEQIGYFLDEGDDLRKRYFDQRQSLFDRMDRLAFTNQVEPNPLEHLM